MPRSISFAKLVIATICCLILILEGCGDPLIRYFDAGVPATYLVRSCESTKLDRVAFCEAYIDGAMYPWKTSTACKSLDRNDVFYCAGADAAEKKIQEVFQSCKDCNIDEFKQDSKDNQPVVDMFKKRMQKFRDDLKTTMGICVPSEEHHEYYCRGYNKAVEITIADLSASYDDIDNLNIRVLGKGQATMDIFSHLWASQQYYGFIPCVETEMSPQQAINPLLEFIKFHPEQQKDSTAILLLEKALFYRLCPGPVQGLSPHMEVCTDWDYHEEQWGARNTCDREIFIQFMSKDHGVIESRVKPDEEFITGLSRSQLSSGWWVFTTCQAGYISAVPLLAENQSLIAASRYSCIKN